ncbi:MAG: VIT1/CCC1 transporter family protein [Corynebacterium sp.]|nr:VIT1/CCC1 transporter family protein [Corynebacterium sp.]
MRLQDFPERLNRIRAGVLGASDGIVSVSASLFGIAAAGLPWQAMLVAALSVTIAGACSMAVGEYVSVQAQVDAEREAEQPASVKPIWAAMSSAAAFTSGAALPSIAMLLSPGAWRLPAAGAAVLGALIVCGYVSSRLSEVPALRPTVRVTAGGALALAITYSAGLLAGP